MSGWLGEWWPLLISGLILVLVVGLGRLVLRLTAPPESGKRTGFETVFRREMVQPIVTHIMAWTFALMAGVLIISFLFMAQYDQAKDIFSYVVAVIGPIIGFWFGSRSRREAGATDKAKTGTSRRP